ncbi:uncharacterized protein H6S33_012721 [Morchella sextelata]|uniref:uncharacterized protein n=1 Tax=Morchella sextelata TaxID=1174677 RepID=UPI001D04F498|nr:uncharacterized protein H6S33_012721 [Morchella sextelata]KAH0609235.1 hypothetical protein H6S33_012721 [Morchella sextelata]
MSYSAGYMDCGMGFIPSVRCCMPNFSVQCQQVQACFTIGNEIDLQTLLPQRCTNASAITKPDLLTAARGVTLAAWRIHTALQR